MVAALQRSRQQVARLLLLLEAKPLTPAVKLLVVVPKPALVQKPVVKVVLRPQLADQGLLPKQELTKVPKLRQAVPILHKQNGLEPRVLLSYSKRPVKNVYPMVQVLKLQLDLKLL